MCPEKTLSNIDTSADGPSVGVDGIALIRTVVSHEVKGIYKTEVDRTDVYCKILNYNSQNEQKYNFQHRYISIYMKCFDKRIIKIFKYLINVPCYAF